jgi:hypothetical protein
LVRKQLLLAVGYSQEEVDAMKPDKMSDEETKQKLKERLFAAAESDVPCQQSNQEWMQEPHMNYGWGSLNGVGYSFVVNWTSGST